MHKAVWYTDLRSSRGVQGFGIRCPWILVVASDFTSLSLSFERKMQVTPPALRTAVRIHSWGVGRGYDCLDPPSQQRERRSDG